MVIKILNIKDGRLKSQEGKNVRACDPSVHVTRNSSMGTGYVCPEEGRRIETLRRLPEFKLGYSSEQDLITLDQQDLRSQSSSEHSLVHFPCQLSRL